MLDSAALNKLRTDYSGSPLTESSVDPTPFRQFETWFAEAVASEAAMPNAMTLATATSSGVPSARIVLLKQADASGFVFFTNYLSRKGTELAANPHAGLLFYWAELDRQVRVEGTIAKVTAEESDDYFQTRPRGSQIGAHVSAQSQVIASREELEKNIAAFEAKYKTEDVPRPAHWGGYRLTPIEIEFWQGRASRIHDRLVYTLQPDGAWRIVRLAP
jgi:pyridoxamine 5'-phosphate oxidase